MGALPFETAMIPNGVVWDLLILINVFILAEIIFLPPDVHRWIMDYNPTDDIWGKQWHM